MCVHLIYVQWMERLPCLLRFKFFGAVEARRRRANTLRQCLNFRLTPNFNQQHSRFFGTPNPFLGSQLLRLPSNSRSPGSFTLQSFKLPGNFAFQDFQDLKKSQEASLCSNPGSFSILSSPIIEMDTFGAAGVDISKKITVKLRLYKAASFWWSQLTLPRAGGC